VEAGVFVLQISKHSLRHIVGVIWQSITYVTIMQHWLELPVPNNNNINNF